MGIFRKRFHLIDPVTRKYTKGTNFSNILRLYHFDSELSNLLFRYLSLSIHSLPRFTN
ncbi:MAG: Abi family protein [Hungatella sp.]